MLKYKLVVPSLLMRHRPDVKLSSAFSSQENLRAALSRTHGVGSLCFGLLEDGCVSGAQAVGLMGRILYRAEVNWSALLVAVSAALQTVPGTHQLLSGHIRQTITEALQTQNSEAFLGGTYIDENRLLICILYRHILIRNQQIYVSRRKGRRKVHLKHTKNM